MKKYSQEGYSNAANFAAALENKCSSAFISGKLSGKPGLFTSYRKLEAKVINIYQHPDIKDVKRLLEQNDLPTNDLSELDLDHFYAYGGRGDPKGIIGLEVYGSEGLLRSFAVSEDSQGHGYGAALLGKLEQHAENIGIDNLYLLTTTAESYFQNKGFEKISRQLASEFIRSTKEFSGLCPDSAAFMHKAITPKLTSK